MGTLISWLTSGGEAVPHDVAEQRAMTCAMCICNQRGTVLSFFTRPAAKLIQEQIERKNDLALWTSVDPLLGVCKSCQCVLTLKCHTPIGLVLKHMKAKTKAKLDPSCWILAEEKALKTKSD